MQQLCRSTGSSLELLTQSHTHTHTHAHTHTHTQNTVVVKIILYFLLHTSLHFRGTHLFLWIWNMMLILWTNTVVVYFNPWPVRSNQSDLKIFWISNNQTARRHNPVSMINVGSIGFHKNCRNSTWHNFATLVVRFLIVWFDDASFMV